MRLKKERVAFSDALDAAIEAARPSLDGKSHRLSVSLPAEAMSLDADALRLAQILSNLLINAAKYSNPGSHIEVQVTHQSRHTINIGEGRGHRDRSGIHQRYIRDVLADRGAEGRSEGGLGIGLALVKGLAELHGGTVEARSAGLGQGSEFIVRLPIAAHHIRHLLG